MKLIGSKRGKEKKDKDGKNIGKFFKRKENASCGNKGNQSNL